MNRSKFTNSVKKWVILALAGAYCGAADVPAARKGTQVDDYFGTKVADPYRWMEDIDSPETAAWVAAEKAHARSELDALPERAAIRDRLTALWNFPKFSLPERRGKRLFYSKNDGLQNQAIRYVDDGDGAAPRVLIDPNALSAEGTVAVTNTSPSEDGTLLGYGLAIAGSDWVEFHVRDVATGRDLPDVVRWVKFSTLAWTLDGRGFFYARYPEIAKGEKLFGTLANRQLCYHTLGTDQAADRVIFELKDHPKWFFSGDVTDDGRYLVITVQQDGKTETAVYYSDLVAPQSPRIGAPAVALADRFDGTYQVVGNTGRLFHVLTTAEAPRGRVVNIDLGAPGKEHRVTAVPQSADSIEDVAFADGKFVIATLHDVQSQLSVCNSDGSGRRAIALPGIGSVAGLSSRSADPVFYYSFSSFLTPPSIMARNLETGSESVFRQPRTPFDASRFETRQVFYASRDGTRIPLFITARKDLKRDGSTPAWLYGYGGFNISITPAYAVAPAVWVEMGGLYAQAIIRGGGEYGEAWHLAGTKEKKQNVFDDFIAAADFLVGEHYTRRDRLVIEGRSNGGLLIGAVLNQRPDLCAVALPTVGVMDMLRYHRFTIGAAWASDYGTSDDPEGFRYLRAYSPVHNVKPGAKYPPVLVLTGDHDDRVYPAHSFKYAAALQDAVSGVPGAGPVLVRIETDAGHGGSTGTSPVSKTIDEWADKMAFAAHHIAPGSLEAPRAP